LATDELPAPTGKLRTPADHAAMAAAIENYLWTINEMIERLD
jgi:hypothetical protein